jgi:hypothetical protein
VVSVSCDEGEEVLKVVSVTDKERTPRGSSGTGLSGCEVDDTGMALSAGATEVEDQEFVLMGLDGGECTAWTV